MKKTFKKFVSVALSVMLCAAAVPVSFVASNAAGGTVTPKVASGANHTVVIKSDGTVWATGYNRYGQLGVSENDVKSGSDTDKTATFTQCVDENGKTIEDATDVACGWLHTAIIRSNGEVWQCGYNEYGQLGKNEKSTSPVPAFVKSSRYTNGSSGVTEEIKGAEQIACGRYHTAVLVNGEVWQCGSNEYGQLGNTSVGTGVGEKSPVFVKSSRYTNGSSGVTEEIKGATQIACGISHTAVLVNGEVWQCGYNGCGHFGNNSTGDRNVFVKSSRYTNGSSGVTEEIKGAEQIACGWQHTAIIRSNGEVWQCGSNEYGQLGNNKTSTSPVPAFVKSSRYTNGSSGVTEEIKGATQIACGSRHTAVLVNGEVWQCGYNKYGQLGNNETSTSPVPAFVKSSNITNAKELATGNYEVYHTMALCTEEDGSYALYGVGLNGSGQLGLGDYNTPVTTFAKSSFRLEPDIENITNFDKDSHRDASGAGQFIGGYRLDVEWSNLQYTYTATWNAKESKWDGVWTAADDNDKIVVKNYSATPCKAEFVFDVNDDFKSPKDGEPGTKGTFTDPKADNEPELDTTKNTVPLAVYTTANPVANQKTVKLGLDGIPNAKAGTDITEATTVGIVTVTLKDAES